MTLSFFTSPRGNNHKLMTKARTMNTPASHCVNFVRKSEVRRTPKTVPILAPPVPSSTLFERITVLSPPPTAATLDPMVITPALVMKKPPPPVTIKLL